MPQPTDIRAFRSALGTFATGVTVITARGAKGELVGNTASSFNSVSLEPPLVLWSLSRSAYSFKAYLGCDHFAVNVLREGQEELSLRFSKSLGDKFHGIDYETWETGCPILPNALAIFECRTAYTYQGGDHVIFVGEVINFDHDPKGKPLVFWRGGYHKAVS
ncbi:MAG: flavin reductase family protein [Hyphomicrobiales bacterium]